MMLRIDKHEIDYIMSRVVRNCGNCKWINQGFGCSQCFNPNQTDEGLISYVYWSSYCDLHTISPKRVSDEEMAAIGYKKLYRELTYFDGAKGGYYYWEK